MMADEGQSSDGNAYFFEINEKVLTFHGPLLYEAKTLKREFRVKAGENGYFVHYAGWSKSWDEWVLESRVLKWNEENLQKQKDLKLHHDEALKTGRKSNSTTKSVSKKRSNVGSDTASIVSASDSRCSTPVMDQNQKGPKMGKRDSLKPETSEEAATRRKRSECVETESMFQYRPEIQIVIPEQIRTFLLDDWDNVVRKRGLVKLPARHSVEQILEDYLKTRKKSDMQAVELCNGLREYFNCLIGNQLLYRYEKDQHTEIVSNYQESHLKKSMSEIYGISHLMRMFTKLGHCLTYTSMDEDSVKTLQQCVADFFDFLVKNFDQYFSLEDYGASDPEYQRQIPA